MDKIQCYFLICYQWLCIHIYLSVSYSSSFLLVQLSRQLLGHSQLLLVTGVCWTEAFPELFCLRFNVSCLQVDLSMSAIQRALCACPHSTKALELRSLADIILTSWGAAQLWVTTDLFPFHHVHSPNKVPGYRHVTAHTHSETSSLPPRKSTKTISSISHSAAFKHWEFPPRSLGKAGLWECKILTSALFQNKEHRNFSLQT